MPLTKKGKKIKAAMEKTYGSPKKAESGLYASRNAGKISGIDKSKKKK
jgi:Tfp pilus assembly protein PilP